MTLEVLEYILEESKYLRNKYGVTDRVTKPGQDSQTDREWAN